MDSTLCLDTLLKGQKTEMENFQGVSRVFLLGVSAEVGRSELLCQRITLAAELKIDSVGTVGDLVRMACIER